jgi:hypothetical protein
MVFPVNVKPEVHIALEDSIQGQNLTVNVTATYVIVPTKIRSRADLC